MVDRRWAMIKLVRPSHQIVHGLLDQHLGAGIHRLEVASSKIRIFGSRDDGARDGQQLLLALARCCWPPR